MGSGASRRGRQQAAGEAGKGLLAEAGGSSPSKPPRVSVPPALRRRRRVLFGSSAATTRLEFEDVAPRDQFTADVPEDPIFDRFGNFQVIHGFLRRAEEIQHHGNDGYLEENAIELLELGLESGSTLTKRLFQVAQAQHVVSLGTRRPLMTCYELLALSSLLRAGEDADLLEFLFCIFDVDSDDRLSVEDLTVSIDAFLGLQDAAEGLEKQEDQDDFSKLDERARHVEARRMAEQAVKEYGVTEAEPEPEEEEEKEEPEGEDAAERGEDGDEEEVVKAPSRKASQHSLVSGASTTPGEGATSTQRHRRRGGLVDDSDSDDDGSKSQKSVSSTKPGHHQDGGSEAGRPVKAKRRSLCGGKKQADSDSDSSTAEKGEEPAKRQKASAKRSTSRGLCRGAPPADESSEGEEAPLTLPKPKPKAKPKPKPRAKRRSRSLCSAGSRRKLPPALGFEQWKVWLAKSQLLPPGFVGLPLADDQDEASADGADGGNSLDPKLRAGAAPGRSSSSLNVGAARRALAADSDSDDSM